MKDAELLIKSLEQVSPGEVAADLQAHDQTYHIFFQCEDETLTNNLEAWLCFSLRPSMTDMNSIRADGPVSQRMLESIPTIQDIYTTWDPKLNRLEIRGAQPVVRRPGSEGRVGCFFSGGVDSWYTFLKHQDEITDLIFIHGIDIHFWQTSLYERTLATIQSVADEYDKHLVVVKTNLRDFSDSRMTYTSIIGPTLASVGHTLSDHFRKIYIAATHTYAEVMPPGSHPLVDPRFSSEALEFVHDGCEADRIAKTARIAQSEIALKTLRVCWENPDQVYNCGKCEKCLRTMIGLQIVGALEQCTTFDEPLNLRRVARMPIPTISARELVKQTLKYLETNPNNRRLKSAIRWALIRPRWMEVIRKRYINPKKKQIRNQHPEFYDMVKRVRKILKFKP